MTWIETFGGRRFDLLNPDPASVDLRDMAHSLARQNRFVGHVGHQYSVGEHCLWVWRLLERLWPDDYLLQLWGQFHDGHEAYTGDASAPLKQVLRISSHAGFEGSALDAVERKVQRAVFAGLRIPEPGPEHQGIIKHADLVMRETERRCPALAPNMKDENWTLIEGVEPSPGLLTGTIMLEPAKMILEPEWDSRFPALVRFPATVALQTPGQIPRHGPLSDDNIERLFRYNAERLLSLTETERA